MKGKQIMADSNRDILRVLAIIAKRLGEMDRTLKETQSMGDFFDAPIRYESTEHENDFLLNLIHSKGEIK